MKIREFLKDHLQKRSAHVPAEMKAQFTPDQQMRMELTGADGGDFALYWKDQEFMVEEKKAETPVVHIRTPARAFLDLMTGKYSDAVDITKMDAGSQFMVDPITMMTPKKFSLLKSLKGTLSIRYCDGSSPNDDTLSESFTAFNGETINEDEPRCTVIMPIGKLERVARGEVTPPQLMMAGGMRVLGDMQMIIQMAPLLR